MTQAGSQSAEQSPIAAVQDRSGRLKGMLLGFLTVVLSVSLGVMTFLAAADYTYLTLAPFAGALAALSCKRAVDSAIVAGLGSLIGILLGSQVSTADWESPAVWLSGLLPLCIVTALMGVGFYLLASRTLRLRALVAFAALVVVIMAMWLSGTTEAGTRPMREGEPLIEWMQHSATIHEGMYDTDLYLYYVQQVAKGRPYYPMVAQTLAEKNSIDRRYQIASGSPLSFRPPGAYWVMGKLVNPSLMVLAMLVMGTLAVVAAFFLARAFLVEPLALLAALANAVFFARVASTSSLMWSEAWAGVFALLAVTALVYSKRRGESGIGPLHLTGAVMTLAATSVRELGVAFILLGLAVTIIDPQWRRQKAWITWLATLAAFAGLAAVHVSHYRQAMAAIPPSAIPQGGAGIATWFDPTWLGVKALVGVAGEMLGWQLAALAPFIALGAVGAWVASRRIAIRVLLCGTVFGGMFVMFLMRPPVHGTMNVAGYWGFIILPVILALFPVAFALVPGWRREDSPAAAVVEGTEAPDEVPAEAAAPLAPAAPAPPETTLAEQLRPFLDSATRPGSIMLGVLAVTAITMLGIDVFFAEATLTYVTLAPLAAIVAALTTRSMADSAGVSAGGIALGVFAGQVVALRQWTSPSAWLPSLLMVCAVAAGFAVALSYASTRSTRLGPLLAVAAVALLVMSMWVAGVTSAGTPVANGATLVGWLAEEPPIRNAMIDEELYLAYVHRLADGQPYYRMVAETVTERNSLGSIKVGLDTPLAYRPPVLYRALALLPQDGSSLVLAMLAMGSLAVVAGYALARRFLAAPLALVSAAAVVSFYAHVASSVSLLQTEAWSGALGLVALAVLVTAAQRGERGPSGLQWAAVAAAFAAAAVRELGLAFLLLGLIATVADPAWRRSRAWLPWIAGLVAFGVAMAAHWSAAGTATAALPAGAVVAGATGVGTWLAPTWRGVLAVVSYGSDMLAWNYFAVWLLAALACAGCIAGPRDRTSRLVLALAVMGGLAIVFLARPNTANTEGLLAGYWGLMFLPTLVATAPLVFGANNPWRSELATSVEPPASV